MDPKTNPRIIDCGPQKATPVVQKKPLAKKPRTEVVVQMGPFIDGNVSTPDSYENLSGPKELLIKPDTGEIAPFDPATPVPENVIRKYITVQAQDNDVPNDLPKSGNGDYILRELPAVVGLDADPDNKVITRVEYVRESYSTSTVTTQEVDPLPQQECPPCDCEKPPAEEPVCEKPEEPAGEPPCEEKPEEPVCEKPEEPAEQPPCEEKPEEPVCEKPEEPAEQPPCEEKPEEPVCEKPEEPAEEPPCGEKPEEPVCEKPANCEEQLDANNDLARTKQNTAVTIDVLSNDSGCDPLCITSAHADNGLVEIVEGKIVYTPKEGFHGNDVINYTISDHGCLTDDANVFVTVTKDSTPASPVVEAPECETPTVDECPKDIPDCAMPTEQCETVAELECEPDNKCESSNDVLCYEEKHIESTIDSIKDSIFERTENLLYEIFSRTSTVMEKAESTRTAWSEALDSSWSKAGAVAACEDVAVVA